MTNRSCSSTTTSCSGVMRRAGERGGQSGQLVAQQRVGEGEADQIGAVSGVWHGWLLRRVLLPPCESRLSGSLPLRAIGSFRRLNARLGHTALMGWRACSCGCSGPCGSSGTGSRSTSGEPGSGRSSPGSSLRAASRSQLRRCSRTSGVPWRGTRRRRRCTSASPSCGASIDPDRHARSSSPLASTTGGYALAVGSDVAEVEDRARRAATLLGTGDLLGAHAVLVDVRTAWRGEPYEDVGEHAWLVHERRRCEELRVYVAELVRRDQPASRVRLGRDRSGPDRSRLATSAPANGSPCCSRWRSTASSDKTTHCRCSGRPASTCATTPGSTPGRSCRAPSSGSWPTSPTPT